MNVYVAQNNYYKQYFRMLQDVRLAKYHYVNVTNQRPKALLCGPPNSTQLNSTGHVTLTAKRDQKKGKKQQLINIPYL